jgi:biotin transport system substrate-specific component
MTVKETTITEGHVSEKLETRDLVLIAQCAAMMTVCSWISVPAAVPFTMQTFGVFMAIGLLGGKRGTAAVAVYLLLGAAGLPVFSGFTGGIGHIMGPTGGYLIGFLFSALVMWLTEHFFGRSMRVLVISMFAGLAVCYAFGTAWFAFTSAKDSGGMGLTAALSLCVLPYVIPDAVKIALAAQLTRRLRPQVAGKVKNKEL